MSFSTMRPPLRLAIRQLHPLRPLPIPKQPTSFRIRSRSNSPPTPLSQLIPRRRHFSQTPRREAFIHKHDPHERLRNARPILTSSNIRRAVRSPRTHTVAVVAVLAAVIFYFSNIQTVPVSGRRRFNCFSDEAVAELSAEQVKRIEYEVRQVGSRFLPEWDPRTRLVRRVLERLVRALGEDESRIAGDGNSPNGNGDISLWEQQQQQQKQAQSQKAPVEWEIRVIDDPSTMNAFVLPGGKVFVHSGILRATRDEAGLAAVLGHEIAHNLASHVGERMSGAIGMNVLLYSLYFLSYMIPGGMLLVHSIGGGAMNVLFSMPMSRMQESEADYIGLMLMAEACYDPRAAVGFWQRMDAAAKREGGEVPELMSTHPSNENRITKVEQWLPEAMEKWQNSDCGVTSSFADAFRRALERGTML